MITIDDLHRLPPSPERNRLIRAERDRIRAERQAAFTELQDKERVAHAIAELTRDAAQRILDELPVDPPRVIQQRRLALLGEAHPTKDEEVA